MQVKIHELAANEPVFSQGNLMKQLNGTNFNQKD
jgi:hypothetical protein